MISTADRHCIATHSYESTNQSPTQWTANQLDALVFDLVQNAIQVAADTGLNHAEVVLSFEDPPQDIVLGLREREVLPRTSAEGKV